MLTATFPPDYADLTDLIVNSEGISLKQYLLELFALAWVSMAELQDGLVDALEKLNTLNLNVSKYPPNAFVPSEAVLELYEGALYRPAKAIGDVGEFDDLRLGDVLQSPVPADGVPALYLVIVQDCDMLRGGAPDAAFLIRGDVFHSHEKRAESETAFPYTTSYQRFTVNWNLKAWRPLRKKEFAEFLEKHNLKREVRIRSPWSLALQSRFFKDLARPAELPAPHDITATEIQLLIRGPDGKPRLAIDFARAPQAYFLEGRADEKSRLVLAVDTAKEVRKALRYCSIDEENYDERTRKRLNELLAGSQELDLIRAGLRVAIKKQKEQEPPLGGVATAWNPSKHWTPDKQAGQNHVMINVKPFKEPE